MEDDGIAAPLELGVEDEEEKSVSIATAGDGGAGAASAAAAEAESVELATDQDRVGDDNGDYDSENGGDDDGDDVDKARNDPEFLEAVRGKLMSISPMALVSEAVHEFKSLFKQYSSIGSGTLTYGEFAELLVRSFPVDKRLTREELQTLIQKLDSGFSGNISFTKFSDFISGPALSGVDIEQLKRRIKASSYTNGGVNFRKTFRSFDKDGNGNLSYDEFGKALKRLGRGGKALKDKEVRCELFWGGGSGGGGGGVWGGGGAMGCRKE